MPNRAHTRKDPLKGKKEFSTNKGFTLVELMIAVAVLAVIMSLALPSYHMLVEKRRVTSSAQQIAAFLSAAKMQAVKQYQNVRLSKNDSAMCIGFTSYAENADAPVACDCTVDDPTANGACVVETLNGTLPELRVFDGSRLTRIAKFDGITIGSDGSTVAFDSVRGMLTVNGLVVASPIEVQLTSKNDMYAMNVRMSATGRVTMCSDMDRADNAVPGYEEC